MTQGCFASGIMSGPPMIENRVAEFATLPPADQPQAGALYKAYLRDPARFVSRNPNQVIVPLTVLFATPDL